jgi:uncharacterized protein YpmS
MAKGKKEIKKFDWVKIIFIALALIFFFLWIHSKSLYGNELELRQECEKDLLIQEKDYQNTISNLANTINNTLTDSINICEKYMLEYQSEYDCYERGSVKCYDKNLYCYEDLCEEQTCEAGYKLACIPN